MNEPARAPACVLLVDDNEDAREMMKAMVEMSGCTAAVAGNGIEALKLLESVRPCLMVIDLMMPMMDGHELVTELRRTPALADIPLVVVTGAPDFAPAGAETLEKPIDPNALLSLLHRTCACGAATAGDA